MPIKGLTDSTTAARRSSTPILGWLSKGGPKPKNGRGAGPDLKDRFRMVWTEGYEWIEPLWQETYGQNPGLFSPVHIAARDAMSAFPNWNEQRSSEGLLIRQCDGECQVRWWDGTAKTHKTDPIPCVRNVQGKDAQGYDLGCKCKATGRLYFIFPELYGREIDGQVVPFGYIGLSTTSFNDVARIWAVVAEAEENLLKTGKFETFRQIPWELSREDVKVSTPDPKNPGGRMNGTRSLIRLRIPPALAAIMVPSASAAPLITDDTLPPVHDTHDADDDFYPPDEYEDEGDLGAYGGDEPKARVKPPQEWDQNMISDWFKAFYATSFERGAWRVVSMDLYGVEHPKDSGLPLFEAIQKMESAQPSMKR